MRHFSDNEKDTIKNIVKWSSSSQYVLINAYNDIFYSKKVEYNHKNSQLIFYRDLNATISHEELLGIEHEILERSILIKYLIDNRYIYLIDDNSQNSIESVSGFNKGGLTPIGKDIAPEISDILYKCANHRVFVGQDLIELSQRNFLTIEDETLSEAKKQTRISRLALLFSILAVIASILCPILITNKVRIVKDQYSTIKDSTMECILNIKTIGINIDDISHSVGSLKNGIDSLVSFQETYKSATKNRNLK